MIRTFPAFNPPDADSPEDAWTSKLWNGLLAQSIDNGCDCIEVRPPDASRYFTVWGRTQGVWEEILRPTHHMHRGLLRRLKVMASFGLVHPLPTEQGRFRFSHRDRVYDVDVTVNTQPNGIELATVTIPVGPTKGEDK